VTNLSDTLDWPFFEDRHRDLAAKLSDWAASEIAPLAATEPHGTAALDALARDLVARLGQGGWLRYCVPAAYGGALDALDVRSLALCRDILATHSGLADFAFVMQGLGTGPITLFGDDALKRRYLPPVAQGRRIAAFAMSEPDAGSDVAAIATAARKDGADYVLDGMKTWISNAGIADHYVVFARTGEAPGARGLSAFVVDAGSKGLRVSERIDVIAPHPLGTLVFDGCRVPASQLLGAPGEGFKVAMATLDVFRSTVGAAALGFARRALDEALARARSRQVFGKPLAELQLIQEKIADMALKVDAAALLVYRAAWTKDAKARRVTREAAMAKLYATEAAQEVIDQAVQVFGAQGVVAGETVERLYREIRALRIYEGTTEIQKLVIAGQTLAASGGRN
jgi:acyl-CoA dehydrogenase